MFNALASANAHFDIDPDPVSVGGFSRGGDVAYRSAYLYSELFAQVLATNTGPLREVELTDERVAETPHKLPIHHLAHDHEKYLDQGA